MTHVWPDRAFAHLVRHFFTGLFDFGIWNEDGADAFRRGIIGTLAIILSAGFLLFRIFMSHVAELNRAPGQAFANQAFAIALPMWTVAFVTALVGHSLFPDETDFRVLMALPVSRQRIFGAKFVALALFAALFIGGTHVATAPLILILTVAEGAPIRGLAIVISMAVSLLASLFTILAVAGVTGAALAAGPPRLTKRFALLVRTSLLAGLIVAVPLVFRLPAGAAPFAGHSPLLFLAPPAWFVGLGQLARGTNDPFLISLAATAVVASVVALVAVFGSYALMYTRFDRLMLRTVAVSRRRGAGKALGHIRGLRPAYTAIREFIAATLMRSPFHQGAAIGIAASGVALTINGLINGGVVAWFQGGEVQLRFVRNSATWAPFPLVIIASLALIAAIAVPLEPRANWVFRMTEEPDARRHELRAVEHAIFTFGVLVPILATLPLQLMVFGVRGMLGVPVALLCGMLQLEVLLRHWRRLPFTCSYIPAKRPVYRTALVAFVAFLFFTNIAGALVGGSIQRPLRTLPFTAILACAVFLLRRNRLSLWRDHPLMFTDELPTDVQAIGLLSDEIA
jgi:hypothetical protein